MVFDLACDHQKLNPVVIGQSIADIVIKIMSDDKQYKLITAAAKAYTAIANKRNLEAAEKIVAVLRTQKNVS